MQTSEAPTEISYTFSYTGFPGTSAFSWKGKHNAAISAWWQVLSNYVRQKETRSNLPGTGFLGASLWCYWWGGTPGWDCHQCCWGKRRGERSKESAFGWCNNCSFVVRYTEPKAYMTSRDELSVLRTILQAASVIYLGRNAIVHQLGWKGPSGGKDFEPFGLAGTSERAPARLECHMKDSTTHRRNNVLGVFFVM